MRLPCGLEAVTSALLICALPTQLALAQTFKAGDTTVEATSDNVAPAGQTVVEDSIHLDYEKLQLTPEVLANLTSHGLTGSDAFQFADNSKAKASWGSNDRCRVMPGDEDWPNKFEWFALDLLTGGALIEGKPQAAACYEDWPEYDPEECKVITSNWTNPYFQSSAPTGIDWPLLEGVSCVPPSVAPPNATCTLGGMPTYVVKATNVAQVQLAVNFARNRNLRLVVKNQGHDFGAKSTGAGALSIWTHFLNGITYIPSYRTSESDGPAVAIGPGVDVLSLYQFASDHDLEAVGGIARTVGVGGGYSAGGGHSPLGPIYGMAADQILGLHVVLPDGRFVFADENHNQDLYWVLRGGGGSTYGIVTSLIYRVYPRNTITSLTYSFATSDTVDNETFWRGIDAFWDTFPEHGDAGAYKYFTLACTNVTSCSLTMNPHFAHNTTAAQLKKLNEPFFAKLSALGIDVVNTTYAEYDSLLDAFTTTFPISTEVMGQWTSHTGSRLWPRSNWEDPSKLEAQSEVIRQAVLKHGMVIGYNFRPADNPLVNQDNAVNPAWRNTLMHLMIPAIWSQDATPEDIAAASKQLTETVGTWHAASPGAGAYMSEANINEPDFQQSFYGSNYERLYKLKQKYDPWSLLYAPTAVGSEDWYITGQIPYYPTQNGRLCPA